MAYKYFLFSKNQLSFKRERAANQGKTYTPGYVIANGKKKYITEINLSGTSRFADAKIIAEGEDSSFKYELKG